MKYYGNDEDGYINIFDAVKREHDNGNLKDAVEIIKEYGANNFFVEFAEHVDGLCDYFYQSELKFFKQIIKLYFKLA